MELIISYKCITCESIESCLNEQRCSVDLPCVKFFVLLLARPPGCEQEDYH